MIKCPECGNFVEEDQKECKVCGYPFTGEEKIVKSKVCPECNSVIEETSKVCSACGYSFEEFSDEETNSGKDDIESEDNDFENISDMPEQNVQEPDDESDIAEVETQEKTNIERSDSGTVSDHDAQEIQESNSTTQENRLDPYRNEDQNPKGKERKFIFKWKQKRKLLRLTGEVVGVVLLLSFIIGFFVRVPKGEYNNLQKNLDKQKSSNAKLTETNAENEKLIKEHEDEIKELKKTETDYNEYKKKMAPFEKLDAAEAKARQIQAEKVAADKKAAEEKAAADKKAAEEAAAQKEAEEKAAEEAKGYETGISYDQLARTPDQFMSQKIKFSGKVIQVMEDSGNVQIRLAVDDDYDKVIYGLYSSSIISSRVLENDHITIYGKSTGTITYQSTLGGNITIPGMTIDKIEQ